MRDLYRSGIQPRPSTSKRQHHGPHAVSRKAEFGYIVGYPSERVIALELFELFDPAELPVGTDCGSIATPCRHEHADCGHEDRSHPTHVTL